MFWYAQRNTHSLGRLNMPVKPCCAGGNLSPPTHNDHLSLVRINEDDRWGRLAALTEAARQEPSANPRDVPTRQDTALLLILSVHGWFRMTFDWSRKMKALKKDVIRLVYKLQFQVFAPGPETFCE